MADELAEGVTLYVPERRKGHGSGHLRRTLDLLRSNGGRDLLFLPEEGDNDNHPRLHALVNAGARVEELEPERFIGSYAAARERIERGAVDRVVFDLQELGLQELREFRKAPLLLGIDAGGEGGGYLDYTVETLPRLPGESDANLADSGYLTLPRNRRKAWPHEIERILVTLGGEDAGSEAAALAHGLGDLYPELTFYYTEGGAIRGGDAPFVDSYTPLREHLHHFDLVVLHYGMTLFEALYARVPVLALPVTEYHAALTRALDLDLCESAELEAVAPELGRIVTDPADTVERCAPVAPGRQLSLYRALKDLIPPGYRNPLEGALQGTEGESTPSDGLPDPAVSRFSDRSYYRCRETGLLYMRRFFPTTIRYREEYFFEEYRKQYGRTYLEDFAHIRKMGRGRLRRIRKLLRRTTGSHGKRSDPPALLDIGCAYGPFLAAAADAGFQPYGIDPAAGAVDHVCEELGFPAVRGTVESFDPVSTFEIRRFEVITMWYVIEHLPDLSTVLRFVQEHLAPGGVFAFGTPNGEGVSARTNRDAFLSASPEDHLTIWEPSRCGAILSRFDLEVASLRITGHHPERFPLIRDRAGKAAATVLRPILFLVSRMRGLGDTFECYCRCK